MAITNHRTNMIKEEKAQTLNIVISEKLVRIQYTIDNISQTKVISHDDLIHAFSTNKINLSIPDGTVYVSSNGTKKTFLISLPPEVKNINWNNSRNWFPPDTKNLLLPIPRTLFIIKLDTVRSNYYLASFCFALKTPFIDLKTKLYKFPFGNVHFGGNICWGEKIPEIRNLRLANGLCYLFFETEFNGDLMNEEEIKEIYNCLNQPNYPNNKLIPANITLKDLINIENEDF